MHKASNLKWILTILKNSPESCILHYNRSDVPWIIVEYPIGRESNWVEPEVVNKLIELSVLTPVLTAEEYQVQYALGSVKAREYKLNPLTNIEKFLQTESYYEL